MNDRQPNFFSRFIGTQKMGVANPYVRDSESKMVPNEVRAPIADDWT